MATADFIVVLDDQVTLINNIQKKDSVMEIFNILVSDSTILKDKLRGLFRGDCTYYKLEVPVEVDEDDTAAAIVERCNDTRNWKELNNSFTTIERISTQFRNNCVHVVVERPQDKNARVIKKIRQDHKGLFDCLKMTVGQLRKWTEADIGSNGGVFVRGEFCPPEIMEIEHDLGKQRSYQDISTLSRDFLNARHYAEFSTMFRSASSPPPVDVNNDHEFATFYHLLCCYMTDSDKIRDHQSSALKSSTFKVHFMQPPFFSCSELDDPLEYQMDEPWGYPTFISTEDAPGHFMKYKPKNNFDVISRLHHCPLLVGKVTSEEDESDRYCMLLQAMAASRLGRYLLKQDSDKQFFLVAVYLRASLEVERYILCPANGSEDVWIKKKAFKLTVKNDAIEFLCELYNLRAKLERLVDDLDGAKSAILNAVNAVVQPMTSLHSRGDTTSSVVNPTMGSIAEGSETSDSEGTGGSGIFQSDDLGDILHEINCEASVSFAHPHLALAVRCEDGSAAGYLKFVREGDEEIEIMQYLNQFDTPANHTIRVIKVWRIKGGRIVFMPVAGGWLSSLKDPGSHLWQVAQQLFEAVEFMHRHNVAHMDIKPPNIIMPLKYGRLTLIDFSVSLRVNDPQQTFTGISGTKGYIAPEVCRQSYSPLRADLWSCGKVIEELCQRCDPSPARELLLQISKRLMDPVPDKRPTMAQVLEWMAEPKAGGDGEQGHTT